MHACIGAGGDLEARVADQTHLCACVHAVTKCSCFSPVPLVPVCRDECPQRGMLMTALRVFEALHVAVFSRLPQAPLSLDPEAAAVWDVRNVLAAEKRRVSRGG
jgi:hypothetical protein